MSVQANYLDVDLIRIDGGTQSRAHLNQETINEYADLFRNHEDSLPPIKVYFDGQDYWNADGFHRLEAAKQANMKTIAAIIEQGTRRDAILFSVDANAEHGLRRTEDDKRRAVNTLLTDAEWSDWSDNQIAKKCKVSQPFVSKLRKELNGSTVNVDSKRTYERNGKTHTMRTNNIGKSQPIQETQEPDRDPNTKEMFDDNQSTEQSQSSYNVISKEEKIATLNKRLDICQDEYAQKSIEYITDLEKKLEEANQKMIIKIANIAGIDVAENCPLKEKDIINYISKMNEQISALTETNNQLFTANENLTKELNEIKQKNADLENQLNEIRLINNNIIDLESNNKTLSHQVNTLTEENKTLKEANSKLKITVKPNNSNQLENTLKEIKSIIELEMQKGLTKNEGIRLNRKRSKILLDEINQTLGVE